MRELPDHQTMLAVRDGDLDKLGYLFEKYHKVLYNFFLRQVENPELSEDFVQDVFIRMLKYRQTYREESKFTTWMYTIARNVKVDHYRRVKNRQDFTGDIDSLISEIPNPEELSESSSRYRVLYRALEQLSDEKREVLIMSRFQNLKYDEISKILDCPVGTIKARIFHAIRDLRVYFKQQTDEAMP